MMGQTFKIVFMAFFVTTLTHAESNFLQQEDKQKHMIVGAGIGLIVAPIVKKEFNLTETEAYWVGVTASLLAGLGKELYDSRDGGTGFDTQDLFATGLGGAVGASPILFFEYKF